MERSGMRWGMIMAEAMLKMRTSYLSWDFDDYWKSHVKEELKRIYSRRWRP